MNLKVKIEDLVLFIWGNLVICKVLSNIVGNYFVSPTVVYYLGSATLIALLLVYLTELKTKVSKNYYYWMIAFVIFVFLFGVLLKNEYYNDAINANVRIMLTFYIVSFLMGSFIEKKNSLFKVIKVSYIAISIILVFICLINLTNFQSPMELIRNFFMGYDRTRNSFGFIHPNYAGNTALAAIMMSSFFNRKNTKKQYLYTVYLLDILFVYVVLESASRTSMIALLIYFLIKGYLLAVSRINGIVQKVCISFLLACVCVVLVRFSADISVFDIFLLTNRSGNFFYNIPILKAHNAMLTGLAYVGSGEFISSSLGTFYVDNYFLYILMSSGMIGVAFHLVFIVVLCRKIFKMATINPLYLNVAEILVVNLIVSMTETCFMYPAFPSSYVFSVIYLGVFAKRIS